MDSAASLVLRSWAATLGGLLAASLIMSAFGQDRRTGKAPDIAGASQWGTIEVKGRVVTIDGHEIWRATGRIRDDGRLQVLWVHCRLGTTGHGVYKIDGRSLIGRWGLVTDASVDDAGELVGLTFHDALRAKE